MFGFRTPAKASRKGSEPPKTPEKVVEAGTSQVRRSIGEWESGSVGTVTEKPKPPTPTPAVAPAGPARPKPKAQNQSQGRDAARSAQAEGVAGSPEVLTYASRTAEARACLNKAKLHLGNSRNLKTDIKTGVTQAIERLFQLVKEAEAVTGRGERRREDVLETPPPPAPPAGLGSGVAPEGLAILNKLEEHGRLLKESNERMAGLKELLVKQASALDATTYAGAVAGGPKRVAPTRPTLHSVVVASRDDSETGEQVLTQVRAAIDAKDGWVRVDRVRKAKDRKVILGCGSEEERRKLKERLGRVGGRLTVEDVKNKDPLLALKDVMSYNSDDDIVKALRCQNRVLFEGLKEEECRLEVRFRRKARNPHAGHVVMRVSPAIWSRMVDQGAVHVDLQKVKVEDHSPLVQCSLCLGYGHGRRFCKDTAVKCSHCGGAHVKSECAGWLANALPSCCNCSSAKLDRTDHNAFSADCPVRRKWDALARASIAYC